MRAAFFFWTTAFFVVSIACSRACEVAPLPPLDPIALAVHSQKVVFAAGGAGVDSAAPDEVDLELSVMPEPVSRRWLCTRTPSAVGGADRSLSQSELDAAVNRIAALGFPNQQIRSRLVLSPRSPWAPNRPTVNLVGQIEVKLTPPFDQSLRAALRKFAAMIGLYEIDWLQSPIRIANLTLRRQSCGSMKNAERSATDEAAKKVIDAARAVGLAAPNLVAFRGGLKATVAGPSYVCGDGFGELSYIQEATPDLDAIAHQYSVDQEIEFSRLRADVSGAGLFETDGSMNIAQIAIPQAIAESNLPIAGAHIARASLLMPENSSFVTGVGNFSVVVPRLPNDAAPGDDLMRAVLARAMRDAHDRAGFIASSAHRRIGRLLAVNVAQRAVLSDDANYSMVAQSVVAAWELIGPKSDAKRNAGSPDMYQYGSYRTKVLRAILPTFGGLNFEGTASQRLDTSRSEFQCTLAGRSALADATRSAVGKAQGAVRVLLDEGDSYSFSVAGCVRDLHGFPLEDMNTVLSVPSVREAVVVVP